MGRVRASARFATELRFSLLKQVDRNNVSTPGFPCEGVVNH
jgi:hypothetical protein